MRILCFLHEDCEGPGVISDWASDNDYHLKSIHWHRGEEVKDADAEADMIVIMGGPMNIYEHSKYPWLAREKQLIQEMIRSGKILIGICLGSQLIADALGSKVFRNGSLEIGWFPVCFTEQAANIFADLPAKATVFHWHGETYELPKCAVRLASSEATGCQAFSYGSNVFAFQFHLEVTKDMVREFTEVFGKDLLPSEYVQDSSTINSRQSYYKQNQEYIRNILDTVVPKIKGQKK